MAIGGDAAAQLWNASSSGQLRMEPDAAREVAASYLRFAAMCDRWTEDAEVMRGVTGFGSLESAGQLQKGFSDKAGEAKKVLGEMATAARGMAEGYLQAAGVLAEVDQLNSDAMRAIAERA
ncbi:hypothetical protein [Nocardia coubleae]|uniref:Uncharacterized protein n=1 Tax=Nocardia coubleae TaxID=356147 RepID=A0A846W5P1_9NOCA|nr:hypothetical protein [Nocardia coubleae]NKX87838.1 hypothetical protein [Nocardia coubleae]